MLTGSVSLNVWLFLCFQGRFFFFHFIKISEVLKDVDAAVGHIQFIFLRQRALK